MRVEGDLVTVRVHEGTDESRRTIRVGTGAATVHRPDESLGPWRVQGLREGLRQGGQPVPARPTPPRRLGR